MYSHSGRRKGNAPCDTSSVAFLHEISVWSIFSRYGLVRAGGRLINFIHLKQEISLMSPKLVFDPCPDAGRLIYAPHVTSWSRFSDFLSPLHRLCGICAFTRQSVGRGDCEVSSILFFGDFFNIALMAAQTDLRFKRNTTAFSSHDMDPLTTIYTFEQLPNMLERYDICFCGYITLTMRRT